MVTSELKKKKKILVLFLNFSKQDLNWQKKICSTDDNLIRDMILNVAWLNLAGKSISRSVIGNQQRGQGDPGLEDSQL